MQPVRMKQEANECVEIHTYSRAETMKAERVCEYHKHGSDFEGNLVVVNYGDDMRRDPAWGSFGAGVSQKYLANAKEMVKERYGNVEILLEMPDLVCRVEAKA